MIPGFDPTPRLAVGASSDRGNRREINEDALFAADPCFLVADGMGGHDSGDLASRAAISAFSERFTAPGTATVAGIEAALDDARSRVAAIAAESQRGAGCTLTGAIRIRHQGEPYWYVLNVGDSRVYLQRGNTLQQLTSDHSLQSELLATGGSAAASTPRNIITRALGSEDDRHDAWLLPIENGSRLLVCSDGLTTELDDEQIRNVMLAAGRAESVVNELMRLALEAGGRDNVTIVLVGVLEGGTEPVDAGESEAGTMSTTLEVTRPKSRVR